MNIYYLKYPVNVLGPGNRLLIIVCGCSKNCFNCMSKYAKTRKEEYEIKVNDIINKIKEIQKEHVIDGITISGGEPFDQEDLSIFISEIKKLGIEDILIFTGYKIEELKDKMDIISNISVLIDGPYIDELNDNLPLRGSSNQRIIFINDKFKSLYINYLKLPRKYEIETIDENRVIFVGIAKKGDANYFENIFKKSL